MIEGVIALENAVLEGRAEQSYWDAPQSDQIEGFATEFSVDAGEAVRFKVNVNGAAADDLPYRMEIFRLGHYGGAGAREVAEILNPDGTVQPPPLWDEARALVDAGNWSVTDEWVVPADAVSGVYLARLQRLDAEGAPVEGATNQIPFVVREDDRAADIVLQTSDTTWHAYNAWAGNNGEAGPNFYGDPSGRVNHPPVADPGLGAQNRAYALSYNRPFITRGGGGAAWGGQNYLFGADYAAISWLEENGYDVSYISGVDTDRLGADYLLKYDAFISVGHDEYWSGDQRANVEAARDAGVHLLFWSGNEVYWKTRWEASISADGTAHRTLVCYKETWANADPNAAPEDYANLDPSSIWTGTWRDTRFLRARDEAGTYIAGGTAPDPISGLYPNCHCAENALTGQFFVADGTGEFGGALDVPASHGALRVWRNTAAADGEFDLAPGIIGYEWDLVPDDANRPPGLVELSETVLPWGQLVNDMGNLAAPGRATHNLTLYRAESGALVFGAGTVFWSWGLSDAHDGSPYDARAESAAIKQFTVNLLADMGVQPATPEPGLARARPSTDRAGARATLDGLPTHVPAQSPVLLTGTATDDDGDPATTDGVVALVEVSVDGGRSWHPAQGTTRWRYAWQPEAEGPHEIRARAIDDSLNVAGLALDGGRVQVTAPLRPATFSLFEATRPPQADTVVFDDGRSVQLGMRFQVGLPGEATGIRYWRTDADAGDSDIRLGHLWRDGDGALLGTATIASGSGQVGWQEGTLPEPVPLEPGTGYIVSYLTANDYLATSGFFAAANEAAFDGVEDGAFSDPFGVIRALPDAAPGGNGVFRYGGALVAPSETFVSSNYWVDLSFRPTVPEAHVDLRQSEDLASGPP
ncbi:DUF4082 domain-containing protein [Rubellimicrobium aerolatum]|uniref:N,N-dimethylformamidase beta subunit family domain-containing protein n=1 Tax=Rubellimicrobium aerolatum TaxID=490979 RepID=A0ABW0SGU9_9RHOB|nr:DUF4082 domain-containing protein [Rubellimicrobium aerolatum]MBP1807353.1 hypothetical protein [Rubellimicrobium aerolatum]